MTGNETKHLIYVGQLTTPIPHEHQDTVRTLLKNLVPPCIPVFTEPADREAHYQTFCKKIMWPLLHNTIETNNATLTAKMKQDAWCAYSHINMEFSKVIVENFCNGDTIWIQDYHLLLLPSFLSRKIPSGQATVGLFIHTPFPSKEILVTLPWREEILRGMLNADHLGFHLYEYARQFLSCCQKILGLDKEIRENGMLGVEHDGKRIMITCMMLAADVHRIVKIVNDEAIMKPAQKNICSFLGISETQMRENIILASVDSVERLKGIPLKLLAIENLLKNQPVMLEKFIMIQIGLTFDVSAESKNELTSEIEAIVNRINSTYRRTDKIPIVVYKETMFLDYYDRLALWKYTRIFLNTSIRDGLNMMPSEYTVARSAVSMKNESVNSGIEKKDGPMKEMNGVVIVSEFSGASRVLTGALKVNPWRVSSCTEEIEKAMRMQVNEQAARLQQDTVSLNNNVGKLWVSRVLSDVIDSGKSRQESQDESVSMGLGLGLGVRKLVFHQGFKKLEFDEELGISHKAATKRLFLFDSRGTLFPSSKLGIVNKKFRATASSGKLSPGSAVPGNKGGHGQTPNSNPVIPPQLLTDLETLSADKNNVVFIITGSIRSEVFKQFGSLKNVNLVAEHGFYINWASSRQLVGGHDPSGNTGWELLGGNRAKVSPEGGLTKIKLVNNSGHGVWIRLLRSSGGFHGLDFPKTTTSFTITTHLDVCAMAYKFWNKGEEESWDPLGVVPIISDCTVTFDFENKSCISSAPSISKEHEDNREKLMKNLLEYVSEAWMSVTKSIMHDFEERTSGTYSEQRDSSLLWRFRDADPDFGIIQAKELQSQLQGTLRGFPVDVLVGKDYVEVRPEGVNKGEVTQFITTSLMPGIDFVLAIGDDSADETMFSMLEQYKDIPKGSLFTVTVGRKPSTAAYYLDDYKEVQELLSRLVSIPKSISSSTISVTSYEDLNNPRKSKKLSGSNLASRSYSDAPLEKVR
jgi:trehalose-phosphatase